MSGEKKEGYYEEWEDWIAEAEEEGLEGTDGTSGVSEGASEGEVGTHGASGEAGTDDSDVRSSSKGGRIEIDLDDEDGVGDEDRSRELADEVLSGLLGDDRETKERRRGMLMGRFREELFRDENYILAKVLMRFRERNLNPDKEFVRMYLTQNKNILREAKGYITLSAYGELDGEYEAAYIAGVLKHLGRLKSMPKVESEEGYKLAFEKYVLSFKSLQTNRILENASSILNGSLEVKNRTLMGYDSSVEYLKRSLAELEGLMDANMGEGFLSMDDVYREHSSPVGESILVSDFDKIEEMNKHYGGVFSGNLYSVLAPPKAGKSKFCARVCHTAMVKYGMNVTVWPVEGGPYAWGAQLAAIHFDYLFNENVVNVKDLKLGVDQGVILRDAYPNEEVRDLVFSAKEDLRTNEDYGRIEYIDRPFVLESFLEDIDTSVTNHGSKLIIIDYVTLIGSRKSMSERERIAEAYPKLLTYAKKHNVAVLSPAQYNQETIKELMKSDGKGEMRTSGGGSSEIIRSSDVSFAFWSSTEDLMNREITILPMPTRFYTPMPETRIYADLGTCNFMSISKNQEG